GAEGTRGRARHGATSCHGDLLSARWCDAVQAGAGHGRCAEGAAAGAHGLSSGARSEEHTSELQSRFDLVCRLLLEKKKHGERSDGRRKIMEGSASMAIGEWST